MGLRDRQNRILERWLPAELPVPTRDVTVSSIFAEPECLDVVVGLRQFRAIGLLGKNSRFPATVKPSRGGEVGTTLLSVYACFALTFSKSLCVFFYIPRYEHTNRF